MWLQTIQKAWPLNNYKFNIIMSMETKPLEATTQKLAQIPLKEEIIMAIRNKVKAEWK